MNHVEALKVARDALKEIDDYPSRNVRDVAKGALRATNLIELVAASIQSDAFNSMLMEHSCWNSDEAGFHDSHRDIIQSIDQHCAAQVAQALAAKPAPILTDEQIDSLADDYAGCDDNNRESGAFFGEAEYRIFARAAIDLALLAR